MRKLTALGLVAVLALPAVAWAGSTTDTARGLYVEARSAQVFIGGCVMSSEAHTVGREAVLAWRFDEGHVDGVPIDGLTAAAAIAGRANLALSPDADRDAVLYVDSRATDRQRRAIEKLLTSRHGELFGDVRAVEPASITVASVEDGYRVQVADEVRLQVQEMSTRHEDIVSCGESHWYQPFTELVDPATAETVAHTYSGDDLDVRWNNPDRQSAFFGSFSY